MSKSPYIIIFLLSLIFLASSQEQQNTFKSYKLFSYQERTQGMIGSRINSLYMPPIHHLSQEKMTRKLALIKFNEVTMDALTNLMSQKPGGVLIILPNQQQIDKSQSKNWSLIMDFYGNKNMIIPVFFVFENDVINYHYSILQKSKLDLTDEEQQEFRIQISAPQVERISGKFKLTDYFTYSGNSFKNNLRKSTLVLASVDQFMPSQEFINEQDSTLSIYLLILQQFQKIHSQISSGQEQNIVFYLTTSGSFGFEGLSKFFEDQENVLSNNQVQSIIFIDNLGSSNSIYLELFGNSDTQISNVLAQNLQSNGLNAIQTYYSNEQSPIYIQNKRNIEIIRISDKQFNEILYTPLQSSSSNKLLEQLVKSLFSSLVTIGYKQDEQNISEMLSIDQQQIQKYQKLFSKSPRYIVYTERNSELNQAIQKEIEELNYTIDQFEYTMDDHIFFTSSIGETSFVKYQDPFLDVYIFLGVATYLSVLYILFKTPLIIGKIKKE